MSSATTATMNTITASSFTIGQRSPAIVRRTASPVPWFRTCATHAPSPHRFDSQGLIAFSRLTSRLQLANWNTTMLGQVSRRTLLLLATLAMLGGQFTPLAWGSDQIPGAPQDHPIAIQGATLHTVAGETIEAGTILFENGKITALGRQVRLPEGCRTIDGRGKHVYPSLIESYSDIGLVEVNSVRGSLDQRETGELNPAVRAAAAFNPDSELIPVNRANGILLAVTAPQGSLLAGRSALMMLDGWTWEDMTLQPDVGMHVNWPRSADRLDHLQEIFDQARRYRHQREADSSLPRDLNLDALLPVLDREMPLIASARRYEEITSVVSFALRNDLRLILLGGYDAPLCAELLRKYDIPVIISGVYRLPSRRHEPYDAGYALPKQLLDAGIRFCISAGGRFGASGIRNLPYTAAAAVGCGLPQEEALRSITLSPAEILGVADRVGSLEPGKDATLFVASGNILETPTQVIHAFIQGRRVDLSSKHTELYRKYSTKYRRLAKEQE
ncbi:MAG: imidazolonepropionase [Planctomycetota bacterium]|nr:MAG: imidazolonepropionase [Planctomycetota bacterium]